MRFFRPFLFSGRIYSKAIFRLETSEKIICLTFDDGPDPHSTPSLLEILDAVNVRAVFFCSGSRAEKYPDLVSEIKKRSHIVGNHGYSHLNGWKTGTKAYVEDVKRASRFTSEIFFRPPYGKLSPGQYRELKRTYRIVFWDLMAYDFDKSFGKKRTLDILIRNSGPGSIIVLHDTPGSYCNSLVEEFIRNAQEKNYSFSVAL